VLKLYGFPLSNYYNKVKLALLEKGVPFEEVLVHFGKEGKEGRSPLGKVPYIETEHGFLSESQVILDYIEAQWPTPPLMPADPWQAAKVREIIAYMDLHVELCARQLYPQAFFGGTLPPSFIDRVKPDLQAKLAALKQLLVLGPYAAGDTFTQADCAVHVSLPLAALASKVIYGEDLVAAAGIDWKSYMKFIGERPAAQQVEADRRADQARAMAANKARHAGA
jgi:glutathione S-transferase